MTFHRCLKIQKNEFFEAQPVQRASETLGYAHRESITLLTIASQQQVRKEPIFCETTSKVEPAKSENAKLASKNPPPHSHEPTIG